MKAADIVLQLQRELPRRDSRFTNTIALSSLVAAGLTVTAVTASAHGLSTGNIASIIGSLVENPISSLTNDVLRASAVTSFAHDLTEGQSSATVEGANEADYNGTFSLTTGDVPNRLNFEYDMAADPGGAATGAPLLVEDRIDGYNGRFTITVIDSTSFTYELPVAPPGNARVDDAFVHTEPRISGIINSEQMIDVYTKNEINQFWAFVSLADFDASRDRKLLDDGIVQGGTGVDRRVRFIRTFFVDVIAPAVADLLGMTIRDDMEDIAVALARSLVGFTLPSQFSDTSKYEVSLIGSAILVYDKSKLVQRFTFETREDIISCDTFFGDERAFRDVALRIDNSAGEPLIDQTISLDDEVLDS